MAIQDAKDFLDTVDKDPKLQAQVKGSFDQVVQSAQQHGFNVTRKDLADELRTRWGMPNAPSSEEDPDTCAFCIP